MELGLNGKCALVTGGSRGIGYAIAEVLVSEGVRCAIVARTDGPLQHAVDTLKGDSSATVLGLQGDTRRAEDVTRFVAEAEAALGGLDIVVNNAARVGGGDEYDNVTDELMLDDYDTKVVGYLRVARAAAPYMKVKGWGRIINISGLSARHARFVSGGARNAAVVQLTKTLSGYLGPHGITVNAVHPNHVMTQTVIDRRSAEAEARGTDLSTVLAEVGARNDIRRVVEPHEVANVVAFLASPLTDAITGDVITVTGGMGDWVYY